MATTDSMIAAFRQKQLSRIEEALALLVRDLNVQGARCTQCGAFHSADLATTRTTLEMEAALEDVRRWQNEPWATKE
jgi:hypothetical protein